LLLVAGLVSWSPALKGGELRSVSEQINAQWQPGDVVYHATGTSWLPMSLYLDEPGYLINEEQHDGLLQTHLQDEFAIPRASLEDLTHQRAWLVWARDILMSEQANQRMEAYTRGAVLVGKINYWQAADIEIYLQDR
jgi:hypothetical protein